MTSQQGDTVKIDGIERIPVHASNESAQESLTDSEDLLNREAVEKKVRELESEVGSLVSTLTSIDRDVGSCRALDIDDMLAIQRARAAEKLVPALSELEGATKDWEPENPYRTEIKSRLTQIRKEITAIKAMATTAFEKAPEIGVLPPNETTNSESYQGEEEMVRGFRSSVRRRKNRYSSPFETIRAHQKKRELTVEDVKKAWGIDESRDAEYKTKTEAEIQTLEKKIVAVKRTWKADSDLFGYPNLSPEDIIHIQMARNAEKLLKPLRRLARQTNKWIAGSPYLANVRSRLNQIYTQILAYQEASVEPRKKIAPKNPTT